MEIEKFIFGIMAFVLFGTISLVLVVNLYSSDNLNVNLSTDKDTQALLDLQNNLSATQSDLYEYNSQMEDRVMTNTTFNKDISSADLVASAWQALTSLPSYIGSFFGLIASLTPLAGSSAKLWLWFFIGIITIGLAIMIIRMIVGSRV